MNSLARISSRKLCRELIRPQSTTASSTSSSDIYIPNRIERSPTDILKALESTISRDYTAPHYKFHDDPYLTPLSKSQIRNYALAKDSGKKSAMWIRQKHHNLFQHKVADPEIKAFVPPPIYTEESKVTEETLLYEISNAHVSNSILIYNLLKGEVTIPTKQALLELLCFYNHDEPANVELLEFRWFQLSKKRIKNTWISRPEIDILFKFLKEQEPVVAAAAYNAMICGLAKYYNGDKVWHMYIECQENNIPLCIEAYNSIISMGSILREGEDKTKSLITDIYKAMATNGITPNIHTFNAALSATSTFKNKRIILDFICNIFADIAKFKLKPTLTTYYYVLRILNKFDDAAYTPFIKILKSLKEETLTIQNAKDLNFFVVAMEMASKQFCERQAGEMVNELLLSGDNYKFIGDSYKESLYYRAYLELILATEEFETFYKIYSKLVPHVTIPEPSVMKAMLEAVQLYPAETVVQYIPKLWSHMVMFNHLDTKYLLESILHLMSVHCKPVSDSSLNAQFAKIALIIWDHIQTQNAKRIQHIIMSDTIVGNIIVLLLRGGNFGKVKEILSLLIESPHLIVGILMENHIHEIFELCLAQADIPIIFSLLEYITSNHIEGANEMARKLEKTISLTPTQKDMLINLVGNDILELQLSNESNEAK